MSTNDLDTALAAIAASLTRSVQQLSDAGTIDDAPSAELAAVGAFLLRYRRERASAPVAPHQTPMARAVIALSPADRIALAQEFEVAVHTVDRWALGYAVPHPEIAAMVERWCSARAGAELSNRLTSNDPCLCGGRGYHASPDESDPVYVYCSCPAGAARERADEQGRTRVATDDGPRLHIPRGLLDGTGG